MREPPAFSPHLTETCGWMWKGLGASSYAKYPSFNKVEGGKVKGGA